MNDKFFPELARRLKREGISTGPVEKGCLPVLADGRAAERIEGSVDDLDQRVDLSNQRELEAADSGAGMTEGYDTQGGMCFE